MRTKPSNATAEKQYNMKNIDVQYNSGNKEEEKGWEENRPQYKQANKNNLQKLFPKSQTK